MSFEWNYNEENYKEGVPFRPLPIGNYRVRIAETEIRKSKSDLPYINLKFDVSGNSSYLWDMIMLVPTGKLTKEMIDQNLGNIYNCFGIPADQRNKEETWVGKVGAVKVKHEIKNGEPEAKLCFYYPKSNQEKLQLPPWQEPQREAKPKQEYAQSTIGSVDGFTPVDDDGLPF
jgi:hypothetical protein